MELNIMEFYLYAVIIFKSMVKLFDFEISFSAK